MYKTALTAPLGIDLTIDMSSRDHDEKKSFDDDVKSGSGTVNAQAPVAIAQVYNPALKEAIVKSDLKGFSRRSFMVRPVLLCTACVS